MATPFLSSEEYDERAHHLYNEGDYDSALRTLKEGLGYYPHSVELYVGMGYARLAREEFVWAKHAFERALVLDPDHEDARVGLGEVLLRFGRQEEALETFQQAREAGACDDLDLLLSMGRALYRERLFVEAREVFSEAVSLRPDSAEAAAALGYVLHRLEDGTAARTELLRALRLDPSHHEARIYLAHMLYDRGDWEGALREFEAVPPPDHWDPVSIWRLIDLKRALLGLHPSNPVLMPWTLRLKAVETEPDPIDQLLAEIESGIEPSQLDLFGSPDRSRRHRVRTRSGELYTGSWLEIVLQMRNREGQAGETAREFMQRWSEQVQERSGIRLPTHDPEAFLRASAQAGLLRIDS